MKHSTTKNLLVFAILFGVLSAVSGGVDLLIGLLFIFIWLANKSIIPAVNKVVRSTFLGFRKFLGFLFFGLSRRRGARCLTSALVSQI